MPRRLYIPRQVSEAISAHITSAIEKARNGFWSANEDEDTLTGHLGACLRIGPQSVEVTQDEVNGTWRWSVDYAKFRGRGSKATESYLGADGIIEISLDRGFRHETKSILFQSKIDWTTSKDLVEQAVLLSTWREASIAINYTPTSFDAYSIDNVLASRGNQQDARNKLSLQDALTQHFLECKVGNTDLRYDARARRLVWRDTKGVRVATQFTIPHRIRIEIEAPVHKPNLDYDKLIPAEEIHQHRMEVEAADVLKPILSNRKESAKVMKQSLAMTYHPDRYSTFDQTFRDLATRRMQEINAASDELKKRRRN
jgi:hypothetical protein